MKSTQTIPASEVAAILGISVPTVYRAIRAGELPGGHKLATCYVINRAVFIAWWQSGAPRTERPTFTGTVLRVV